MVAVTSLHTVHRIHIYVKQIIICAWDAFLGGEEYQQKKIQFNCIHICLSSFWHIFSHFFFASSKIQGLAYLNLSLTHKSRTSSLASAIERENNERIKKNWQNYYYCCLLLLLLCMYFCFVLGLAFVPYACSKFQITMTKNNVRCWSSLFSLYDLNDHFWEKDMRKRNGERERVKPTSRVDEIR